MYNNIVQILQLSLIAWTVTNILMRPGMILHTYFLLLDGLAYRGKEWIAKPLGYCDKCLAGQLAVWYLIFNHFFPLCVWYIVDTLFFVCGVVFVVYQMNRIRHDD